MGLESSRISRLFRHLNDSAYGSALVKKLESTLIDEHRVFIEIAPPPKVKPDTPTHPVYRNHTLIGTQLVHGREIFANKEDAADFFEKYADKDDWQTHLPSEVQKVIRKECRDDTGKLAHILENLKDMGNPYRDDIIKQEEKVAKFITSSVRPRTLKSLLDYGTHFALGNYHKPNEMYKYAALDLEDIAFPRLIDITALHFHETEIRHKLRYESEYALETNFIKDPSKRFGAQLKNSIDECLNSDWNYLQTIHTAIAESSLGDSPADGNEKQKRYTAKARPANLAPTSPQDAVKWVRILAKEQKLPNADKEPLTSQEYNAIRDAVLQSVSLVGQHFGASVMLSTLPEQVRQTNIDKLPALITTLKSEYGEGFVSAVLPTTSRLCHEFKVHTSHHNWDYSRPHEHAPRSR